MGDPGKKRKKKRKGSVTPFTQFSALSAGSAKPPRPLLEGSPCPRQSPRGPVVRFKAGGAGGPDVGCQDPRGTGDTVTSTAAEDVVAERAAAAQLEHQADIRKSLLYKDQVPLRLSLSLSLSLYCHPTLSLPTTHILLLTNRCLPFHTFVLAKGCSNSMISSCPMSTWSFLMNIV